MSIALARVGREIMRRAVAIISIILVFAFAFVVTGQEISSSDDTIANLKQQLMEIEWIKTESRIRLEELDEELKPENIEQAVAGVGSTHPEELREYRRRVLTSERDGIQTQLDVLEEKRAQIKAAIVAAQYVAYLKYALPSPTPSPVTPPSKPMTELMPPENVRPLTGTLRGAIISKGPEAQSYNIPGANLKLKGTAQLIEASSNDQGEYEFANLSAGEYTLEVSAEGFKNVRKVVVVRTGKTLIENIPLEEADIQESVTVKSTREGVHSTEAMLA
jgi:hypothetical protein